MFSCFGNSYPVSICKATGRGGDGGYTPENINRYTAVGGHGGGERPGHQVSSFQGQNYGYIGDTYLAKMTSGAGIDEIVERDVPGNVYYFFQDHEGSVTHVADINGLTERYRYDAFGAPTIKGPFGAVRTGGSLIGNRFLFTGREYDADFGIYEYRARAYSPSFGRFMTEDPKGFAAGDYNLFRYCKNDPLDLVDPMGLATTVAQSTLPWDQLHTDTLVWHTGSMIPTRVPFTPLIMAQQAQTTAGSITRSGNLAIDTDGTGQRHGNSSHQPTVSGALNSRGEIVPKVNDDLTRNRAAVGAINADRHPYGVAPKELSSFNGGPLHAGDKMKVEFAGRNWSGAIGDFGPGITIEISVRAAAVSKIQMIQGRNGQGLMPSLNGRTTPDIPATAVFYPGTYP